MKKKFPIFVLLILACLSCVVFAACGDDKDKDKEEEELITLSSLQVLYNEEDISEYGKNVTMTMLENVEDVIENKLKVNLIYSNEQIVEIHKNTSTGYKVTSTIPQNLITGNYTYTISYGNLNSVVINVGVVKTYDKIVIGNLDKQYDGQAIKKPTIETLNKQNNPIIKWLTTSGEELEEPPIECGEYYLQVTTLDTDEFLETKVIKHFVITKAIPSITIPEFNDTYYIGELNSLNQLSLPNNFVWDEEQEIKPGENYYYATYTPQDQEHYYVIDGVGIMVKVLEKLEKPSINGTYYYTGETQKVVLNNYDNNTFIISNEADSENQIDAGEYNIKIQIADKTKYCWKDKTNDDINLTWTIEKVDPIYNIPQIEKQSIKNVVSLNDIELPENFVWQDGQTLIEGINTYFADYIPQDEVNYNSIYDIEIEVEYYIHENLQTPQIEIEYTNVIVDVMEAVSYNIEIYKDSVLEDEFNVETCDIDLLNYKDGTEFTIGIKVQAVAEGDYYLNSEWSEMFEKEFTKLDAPVIEQGVNLVTWQPVENAEGYAYKINDGEVEVFVGSELVLKLEPTDTVVIKALSGNTFFVDSEWSNEITIPKQKVAVPTILNNNVTLEGLTITVKISGYNSSYMTLSGSSDSQTQSSAGIYHFIFKLKDSSKYTWEDETIEDKVLDWIVL